MNGFKKLYEDWFSLPAKTRFFIAASFNFVISLILFMFLVTVTGFRHYRICVFIQWFVPSLIVYLIQRYFVFKSKGDIIYEYLKYCGTWFFCFICNVAILELIVMSITKNVYSAQFFAYTLVTILSYSFFKNLTYIQKKD